MPQIVLDSNSTPGSNFGVGRRSRAFVDFKLLVVVPFLLSFMFSHLLAILSSSIVLVIQECSLTTQSCLASCKSMAISYNSLTQLATCYEQCSWFEMD